MPNRLEEPQTASCWIHTALLVQQGDQLTFRDGSGRENKRHE